jgi:LasA protease
MTGQNRKLWRFWAAIWILVSLACNLPVRKNSGQDIPVEALRQTLAARAVTATPPVAPASTSGADIQATPVSGLATATSIGAQPGDPTSTPQPDASIFYYYSQPGDTLGALALRFDVTAGEITSDRSIPPQGMIPVGQLLRIPRNVDVGDYPSAVLPDTEVLDSPSAVGFDLQAYVAQAGGYLSTYVETFNGEQLSGAESIRRVAIESSINPRFLLALLEFCSGWVFGQPADSTAIRYPIGFHIADQPGLYRELVMAATHLNIAYYGWRAGSVTTLKFKDGKLTRMSPELNAGSIAVQYLLAKFYDQADWPDAMYGPRGFLAVYQKLFGDPWTRSANFGPLFPDGLAQPTLELPFQPGERWSLTAGPHPSWKTGSPRGALDFAPVTGEEACAVSRVFALAAADGLVVRSERNAVALDLDGDGNEQTGWVILYMHLADKDRIAAGERVQLNDRLGHPSCEGGTSTGTHLHIARKYNGEWVAADGPLPFVLSGWVAYAWEKNYYGELRKGTQVVVASPVGPQTSIIVR